MELFLLVLLGMFTLWLKWMDCITTHVMISRFGVGAEKNPVARWLMKNFGTVQTYVFIMGVHTFVAVPFVLMAAAGVTWLPFLILNGIMSLVVLNNLWQMKKNGLGFKHLVE